MRFNFAWLPAYAVPIQREQCQREKGLAVPEINTGLASDQYGTAWQFSHIE